MKTLPFSPFPQGPPGGAEDTGRKDRWPEPGTGASVQRADTALPHAALRSVLTRHWMSPSRSTTSLRKSRRRLSRWRGRTAAVARGVTAPTSAVAAPHDVPTTGTKGFSFLHVLSPRHKSRTSNTLLTSRTPSGTDCNPTTVLALPNPHLILNQDSRLPATPPLPAPGSLLPRVLRNPPLTDTGDLPRARRRLSKRTGSRGSGALAKPWVGRFRYEFIHHGLN